MKTLLITPFLLVISRSAFAAPIPLSPDNLTYVQNFDGLAMDTGVANGTNGVAATTWADDSTIPGWWWYLAGAADEGALAGTAFSYYVADGLEPPNERFLLNATASNGSPLGWVVPGGGPAAGTAGPYANPVSVTLPIAGFAATGTVNIRVEDAAESGCFSIVPVTAPLFIQAVTASNSPMITFTRPAVGAIFYAPPDADQSELGWSGGTGASDVQTQPSNGVFTGTAKYFRINGANTTFTSRQVDVSAVAGHLLQGQIELGFCSTNSSGFEADDVLNARMEVAVDGNFSNAAGGNVITANFIDEPGIDTDTFDEEIAVAATYINLNAATYPTTDFIFHLYLQTVPIPAGALAARARIIFASGANIGGNEHVLLDNVRFSLTTVAPDADGDEMPDAYEDANGLDKNSNTDRDTDLDGDGQPNYLEFVAGTAANDATDYLHVIGATMSAAGEISLTWASIPGKRYRDRISTDLGNTNAWTTLRNPITATASSSSIPPGTTLSLGLFPRYFLKIEIVP